ncbi:cation diffusion facilitator family transporter [Rhizomonospora bruguierae]|uniref:cation diffusion facilitator family transporter n=1 Tax=Rhizomonospora bruguierae TaxID=1581705 RepID=UPI001BCC33E2|nr:cation diffusion facilitator family transporter [Micromonospora sp. NBRC 107566]
MPSDTGRADLTPEEPATGEGAAGGGEESLGTVIIAGLANLAIAAAKAVAGLMSGSAAMLSESAHSVADTVTEVLLFTALRRGAKPPDDRHPFGYGKERYVWALFAAISLFAAGAGYSFLHGYDTIRYGEEVGSFLVAYVVLAISFVIECVSLTRALRQVRSAAARWSTTPRRFLRLTADTAVKAVFLEDTAALIGLTLAAAGLALTELTGSRFYDGAASIAIGVLLLVVAGILTHTNVSLLVGRAVPKAVYRRIHEDLSGVPTVDRVGTLLTMQLGPDEILVAARVDFADDATGADIEAAADEAERRLTERYPGIKYLFLDPTRGPSTRRR